MGLKIGAPEKGQRKQRGPASAFTDSELSEVLKAIDAGWAQQALAKKLGIDINSLGRYLAQARAYARGYAAGQRAK